jgi:D,D-heptose 1,7-bisphosphate phosphatase/four helix bundle protein
MDSSAIFFDRDGVIIKDVHLLTDKNEVEIYPEAYKAFSLLRNEKLQSIIITNQTVVGRGLISENNVKEINDFIVNRIYKKTDYMIEAYYYCPHHPNADLKDYRINCDCRKPKSGMLLQAAKDYIINLKRSWMIGDRISDINAGYNAGCKTILVETGKHLEKPIESDALDLSIKPDFICKNILEAVEMIVNVRMSNNVILDKSLQFALSIIEFCDELEKYSKFVIAKQLLKSGTSIGANIREAQNSESNADFIHKFKIAAKEANETEYWLLLCKESKSYPYKPELLELLIEMQKIISKIISTAKRRMLK